ncbi:hypothetical protein KKF81_02310 [Candidatus Micrarchaeota archaeon]|nr:hypothetical protein [Candidatus Micrarchaeota archaeon]MBU1165753.1 hypothetical protein [Candidatus Micrarchaeota archaeon]MBU1887139.1 hypothetical protein [Candidatus Micrarchaeota archaeon]
MTIRITSVGGETQKHNGNGIKTVAATMRKTTVTAFMVLVPLVSACGGAHTVYDPEPQDAGPDSTVEPPECSAVQRTVEIQSDPQPLSSERIMVAEMYADIGRSVNYNEYTFEFESITDGPYTHDLVYGKEIELVVTDPEGAITRYVMFSMESNSITLGGFDVSVGWAMNESGSPPKAKLIIRDPNPITATVTDTYEERVMQGNESCEAVIESDLVEVSVLLSGDGLDIQPSEFTGTVLHDTAFQNIVDLAPFGEGILYYWDSESSTVMLVEPMPLLILRQGEQGYVDGNEVSAEILELDRNSIRTQIAITEPDEYAPTQGFSFNVPLIEQIELGMGIYVLDMHCDIVGTEPIAFVMPYRVVGGFADGDVVETGGQSWTVHIEMTDTNAVRSMTFMKE